MPSKSKKQRKFMAAAANNPKFAKKAKIPQSVAKKYNKADRSAMTTALGGNEKKGGYAG
jgi:hypothetical protein